MTVSVCLMERNEADILSFMQHLRLRRYSDRTMAIYEDVLRDYFLSFNTVTRDNIRSYEVMMMDGRGLSRKTVNLHLSVLSSYCSWLVDCGVLKSNPVHTIRRPKNSGRLPEFYRSDSMQEYFSQSSYYAGEESYALFKECLSLGRAGSKDALDHAKDLYNKRLARAVVQTLFSLGLRRAELIDLRISSFGVSRSVMTVTGKGDKTREIPVPFGVSEEILLYLQAVEELVGGKRSSEMPLFVTFTGEGLYPMAVDRFVKSELGEVKSIHGRKSPHVLRHTVATELLDEGTDLNSIKEFLGHSSLATTQIYTHNSIAKLKKIYESAHPRAKKGGNYGD